MRKFILLLVLILALPATAFGVNCPGGNLYVDFDGGSDAAVGTSTGTAWKHSPGDDLASGNANCITVPGNTVNFKGGVKLSDKESATEGWVALYNNGEQRVAWGQVSSPVNGWNDVNITPTEITVAQGNYYIVSGFNSQRTVAVKNVGGTGSQYYETGVSYTSTPPASFANTPYANANVGVRYGY